MTELIFSTLVAASFGYVLHLFYTLKLDLSQERANHTERVQAIDAQTAAVQEALKSVADASAKFNQIDTILANEKALHDSMKNLEASLRLASPANRRQQQVFPNVGA